MSFFSLDVTVPAASSNPVVEWEEPDCLLCGGRNWLPLVEAADEMRGGAGLWFVVVQCQECGLCFTNPRPSPPTMRQFYPSDERHGRTSARPGPRRPILDTPLFRSHLHRSLGALRAVAVHAYSMLAVDGGRSFSTCTIRAGK